MLIKNAKIVDVDGTQHGDVLIENGLITKVAKDISAPDTETVIDAHGMTVMPAFIDLHCHFRDPGFTHKEDLCTGSKAAAKGGYTYVNLMANTNPVCSSATQAEGINKRAEEIGLCEVHQVVSITKDFDGADITHLENLPNFVKAVSDDGKGVTSNDVMAKTMSLSAQNGFLIMSHAEDMTISKYDYRLAENIETARNILLAKHYGANLHMSHVSTKESIEYIIQAKKQGVNVSCEVGPHHIYFSDKEYKVNPPIREKADKTALIQAVKDGYVDCIATDHAPHTMEDKLAGAPGMVGLETAFGASYSVLVTQNEVTLPQLSALLSANPAKIMGLNKGKIQKGYDGDVVLVDTDAKWVVDPKEFASRSQNTMFEGEQLQGMVKMTVKKGEITYRSDKI